MRKYKKEDIREARFEDISQEKWDFKKILVFLVVIAALILGGFYIFNGSPTLTSFSKVFQKQPLANSSNINTPQNSNVSPKKDVQVKLDNLKKEISNLNASDITKNSPQIKKVQNDLQSLEGLPANKAKQVCFQLCSGF